MFQERSGCDSVSELILLSFPNSQLTPVKSECELALISFSTSPSSPSRMTLVIMSARSEAFWKGEGPWLAQDCKKG